MKARRVWLRRLTRIFVWTLGLLLLIAGVATAVAWQPIGHRMMGERRARAEHSTQWRDGHFENPQPLWNDFSGSFAAMRSASPVSSPTSPLGPSPVDPQRFTSAPSSGLRITWMGHSTSLVEIDGVRLLLDPVWSDRPTPIPGLGPRRWYPPLVSLDSLPPIDAVLVSHDHYDHLDMPTVTALARKGARFIVPLGIGAHLEYWGVPVDHITELDWWDSTAVKSVRLVSTPARHASGRSVWDKDATLWTGFAILGDAHRVYYSGDTGLFPAMRAIGERYGPFDCTLIEVGQYNRAWPDWHIGPEQAVQAHELVRGKVMLPVHWGLFRLAMHGWTEPMERVLAAATSRNVIVATPRPGESVEPTMPLMTMRWWPSLPWETSAQHPIVSTQMR